MYISTYWIRLDFQSSPLIKQDGDSDSECNSVYKFSWRLVAVLVESSWYMRSKGAIPQLCMKEREFAQYCSQRAF